MKEQEILYKLNKMKDSHEINTLKKQVQKFKNINEKFCRIKHLLKRQQTNITR